MCDYREFSFSFILPYCTIALRLFVAFYHTLFWSACSFSVIFSLRATMLINLNLNLNLSHSSLQSAQSATPVPRWRLLLLRYVDIAAQEISRYCPQHVLISIFIRRATIAPGAASINDLICSSVTRN